MLHLYRTPQLKMSLRGRFLLFAPHIVFSVAIGPLLLHFPSDSGYFMFPFSFHFVPSWVCLLV